jgi:3-hydroxy-9,10-secoandrosta-1,3,5(10)-triene-9,17-dione monooxygenase reductase component
MAKLPFAVDTVPTLPAAVDQHELRQVAGSFCSGVTVVAACGPAGPVGMTCQSFFSLSLDPPLIAFSPSKSSTSYPAIRGAGRFAVNILSAGQDWLAVQFARPGTDKWRGVPWSVGPGGSPVIGGALAVIECRIEAEHDAGDHHLVVGLVLRVQNDNRRSPLVFYRSGFARLSDAERAG